MPSPMPIAPPVTITLRPVRSMSPFNGVVCDVAVAGVMFENLPGGRSANIRDRPRTAAEDY